MLALDLIEIDEIEKDKQLILMASGVHATHLQLHFASLVFYHDLKPNSYVAIEMYFRSLGTIQWNDFGKNNIDKALRMIEFGLFKPARC